MANKNLTSDLPDSERDKEELQPDEAILDLPDVKDIPGQEFVHVPNMSEMADTTISSDDEEGIGLFDEDADNAGERLASGEEISEDDMIIGDEDDLDTNIDDEEDDEPLEDEVDVTDDHVSDDSDVSDEEKKLLEQTEDVDSQDNEDLYRAELDDTDFDGEKLNEDDDDSGDDLDVPGAEEDDADEEIGEEDEENNDYSLGDTE